MKPFAWITKYVFIPISSIVGMFYGVDMYFIQRANTVVEPTRVKVDLIQEHTKLHQERVERELLMIRSTQDETNKFLREHR